MLNGITSHTFDYDDTHLRTIIHPAGPVASAALAIAEHSASAGGSSSMPSYSASTSPAASGTSSIRTTTNVAGTSPARPARRRRRGVSAPARTRRAADDDGARHRRVAAHWRARAIRSMTKPSHVGGAARAGLMSALMARHGYTSSARALEAPRGLLQTCSTRCAWREIADGLGQRCETRSTPTSPSRAAS